MQDRIPLYPGRVTLTPVSGQANTYDMARADQPTEEGTPLNKNTLLKDATAALYGLGSDAVPDEVLGMLKGSLKVEKTVVPDTVFLEDFVKVYNSNYYIVDLWTDGNIVVAIFYTDKIYRSVDGGKSFSHVTTIPGNNFGSLFYYKDVLIACPRDDSAGSGYYSTDKGETWTQCTGNVGTYPSVIGDFLYSAQQTTPNYNTKNIVSRTQDGKTWETIQENGPTYGGPITKIGNNYIKICYSTAGVYTCTNSSLESSYWTFNSQFRDLSADSPAVDFSIFNGVLYIFLKNGYVLKTVDGTNYSRIKSPPTPITCIKHSVVNIGDKLVFLWGNTQYGSEYICGWIMDSDEQFHEFSIESVQTYGKCGTYGNGTLLIASATQAGPAYSNIFVSKDTFKSVYALQTPTGGNVTDKVAQALGSVKVETGEYTGTNTYGESNPTVLSFSGKPFLVLVLAHQDSSENITYFNPGNGCWGNDSLFWVSGTDKTKVGQSSSSGTVTFIAAGNTLSFYASSAQTQMNASNYKYRYAALTQAGGDT